MTTVSQLMTRGVRVARPGDSLFDAAQAMQEMDIGVLPVCDGERLVGLLTDRDIAMRGVGQNLSAQRNTVSDVLTEDVRWCFEDDSLDDALAQMESAQIRRLPVVNRDKKLVGMLSLGDIATRSGQVEASGEALAQISQPEGTAPGGQ